MNGSVLQQLTMVTLLMIVRLYGAVGYADGAPRSSCDELRPIHRSYVPQQTPNPYRVQFLDNVVDYRCNDVMRSRLITAP